MTSYSALSHYYDELNEGCPYGEYADFIAAAIGKKETVLDCGCGTGNISLALAGMGYAVTAFDISEDALAVADEKVRQAGESVRFIKADMRRFSLGSFDAVISTFDSVNYLLYDKELSGFFESAYASLRDGGVLVFDVNTRYRYENVYADNCYALESENAFLSWQNFYNESNKRCRFYLSLFALKKNGLWERYDEEHTQKYHDLKRLERLAKAAGLETADVYGGTDFSVLTGTSEKAYFVMRKK